MSITVLIVYIMQRQILTPKPTLHPNLNLVWEKKNTYVRIVVRHCTTGSPEDVIFLFKDCREIKKIKVKYKQVKYK